MVILKKTLIFQGFRGVPTFSRWGVHFFPEGVRMLNAIETNTACDFSGGLDPTLDLCMFGLYSISPNWRFKSDCAAAQTEENA